MKTKLSKIGAVAERRGSTLVIVIALLGLLAFTGMVFFTFSSQERSAAEYFSEAAKAEVDEPDNVWDHPLRHIIVGGSNRPTDRASITWSATRRHSIVSNLLGNDLAPLSGEGIHLIMEDDPATGDTTPVPRVDMDWDGTAEDENGDPGEPSNQSLLNFVDSPVARFGNQKRPDTPPAPDADYTAADINSMFLAYKGWAIRDNDPASAGGITPRYERVPIIIPSFFRPQYMKTGGANGFAGNSSPTDIDWASSFDGTNRPTAKYPQRTMRPHPSHIAGFQANGTTPVFRFLTNAEAAAVVPPLTGGFPFVPDDNAAGKPGGLNGIKGEMGVWTGSDAEAYELDADNDGDGIREGIWIDTNYPVQEYVDGSGNTKLYVVIHSFTIYELDGLINLNVHGNLAGLDRSGDVQVISGSGLFAQQSLSRSNLGLGPNEVNPIWAFRTNLATAVTPDVARQFVHHFGHVPANILEQANMEWLWILSGRAQIDASNKLEDLFAGRWGETDRLFNAFKPGGTFDVQDFPRPGRPGAAQSNLSAGVRFGGTFATAGRDGFDDNLDSLDGELAGQLGRVRAFGTPLDYAGTGRNHNGLVGAFSNLTKTFDLTGGDIRTPLLHHDTASTGPERFMRYNGYSLGRDVDATQARYLFGQNGTFDNCVSASDDLMVNPSLDALFEDPLESIFDAEFAQRDFERVFGPQDAFALHLTAADLASSPDEVSERLKELSPYALDDGNAPFSFNEKATPGVRGRFTTISNSLRRFLMRSPFGADGKPGIAGIDDNNDGTIDNLLDLTDPATNFVKGVIANGLGDNDSISRSWEFSADTDGNSTDGSGFPNGDGFLEFPPAFGSASNMGRPYSTTDPFRPQVRRLMTVESGASRSLVGQLPLSINHLLDVERNQQTPAEGSAQFLQYLQRAGMRFRPLTDHPSVVEGNTVLAATAIPVHTTASPVLFPPTTVEQREFWARRDRQKLARDIYVLLYTTGGAGVSGGNSLDYRVTNDPSAAVGLSLYTHEQLRRMAQFAANMVDAMDSDNVVTKFEYDKNLGPDASNTFGGWNMDDDPYDTNAVDAARGLNEDGASALPAVTGNGLYQEDGVERGVVYGVEAQELAFSEVFAATSPDFGSTYADSPLTVHTDVSGDTNFLHIEVQNMRPTKVDMATTVTGSLDEEKAVWQLARYDRTAQTDPEPTSPTERLTLMQGNPAVDGGEKFTIAIAGKPGSPNEMDPTGWQTADLYLNYDADAGNTFELISPDMTTPPVTSGTPVTPQCDLDLIASAHAGRWLATGNSLQPGQFINGSPLPNYGGNDQFDVVAGADAAFEGFDMVLRRRANPNMPQLPLASNPWIEVDRIKVVFHDIFKEVTDPMTMATDMQVKLDEALAFERAEVLDATNGVYYSSTHVGDPGVEAYRFHTINSVINRATAADGGSFNLLQRHYDREFGSAIELTQLPLVGPNLLTNRLNRMRYSPYQQVFDIPNSALPAGTPLESWVSSAEAMLLQPDFPNLSVAEAVAVSSAPTATVNQALDNRWYRLLQFVEVPSRVHRMLGNYIALQKLPGKLNINMIRHREVLAGLIDNPYLADVPSLADLTPGYVPGPPDPGNSAEDGPFMTSSGSIGSRDLWHDFIKDRDGLPMTSWNPVTGSAANFWLPATPNAKPFRSPAFRHENSSAENGFDDTILFIDLVLLQLRSFEKS